MTDSVSHVKSVHTKHLFSLKNIVNSKYRQPKTAPKHSTKPHVRPTRDKNSQMSKYRPSKTTYISTQ